MMRFSTMPDRGHYGINVAGTGNQEIKIKEATVNQ